VTRTLLLAVCWRSKEHPAMRKTLLALSIPFLLCALAHAASFDCTKAKTAQEKAICATPELSKADEQLAAAYKAVLAAAPPEMTAEIREGQRTWLRQLAITCKQEDPAPYATLTDCLETEYASRIDDLRHMIVQSGGVTFVWRKKTVKDESDDMEYGGRPCNVVSYSWPQANRNTLEWKAWNRVIEMETQGPSPGCRGIVATSLGIVNSDLVAATIDVEWSAPAAPRGYSIQFNWLLRKQRELESNDVFTQGSKWELALQKRCIEEFRKAAGNEFESIFQPRKLSEDVRAAVESPESWQLDGEGLTIIFPPCSVASCPFPEVSVAIPWSDLKPYLNPDFVPLAGQ
jgi:uncharacterized protein